MVDQHKVTVETARHRLENIVEKIEDRFEDLSEEAVELWQEAKPKLTHLQESLVSAEQSLHTNTDEARLQAHLAIMDAQDQWSYLGKTVTELVRHAQQKSRPGFQQAELQAHLAKMDTRDFMNVRGKQISQNFKQAKIAVEEASLKAAENLGQSLEGVGDAWTKIP